jgi:hypothetical protein
MTDNKGGRIKNVLSFEQVRYDRYALSPRKYPNDGLDWCSCHLNAPCLWCIEKEESEK